MGRGKNKELIGTTQCNSVAEASTQEIGEEIGSHTSDLPVNALIRKPLGGVFVIPKYLTAYDFGNKAFTIGTHVLTGQTRTLLFHFYTYLIQANSHQLQRKPKNLETFRSHIIYGCVFAFPCTTWHTPGSCSTERSDQHPATTCHSLCSGTGLELSLPWEPGLRSAGTRDQHILGSCPSTAMAFSLHLLLRPGKWEGLPCTMTQKQPT